VARCHNGVMSTRLGTLLGCLLLLTACGDGSDSDADDPASSAESRTSSSAPEQTPTRTPSPKETSEATEASSPPAADGTRIVVDDSNFGPMLFDETGQAIYLFDVETTSEAECYDDCAVAWPPVFTDGDPVAGDGVDASLLGTTERSDGRLQVTYNDHPLYFYAHEGKHEVLCHDVFLNGGNWYVVQPGGDAAPPG
jgi:predicted lipoprotein with Yx(FWY)xxD motif